MFRGLSPTGNMSRDNVSSFVIFREYVWQTMFLGLSHTENISRKQCFVVSHLQRICLKNVFSWFVTFREYV